MKKALLLLTLCLTTVSAWSQNQYVTGSIFFQTEFESSSMKITVAPEYGRFLNSTSAVGTTLKYQYEKGAEFENVITLEPYYRKYFLKKEKIGIFCDGVVGLVVSLPKEGDTAVGFKAGLAPGFDIALTNDFYFVSKIGFVGYNQPGAFDGKKYVRVSLDASDITFGVRYNF